MEIKIIEADFKSEDYNKAAYHPMQTWEWGKARKKMGISLLRLGEFEKNVLKNVYQVSFHKIPYTNYKIGYLPRSIYPQSDILNFLLSYAKKNNTIFIKIEPYVRKDDTNKLIENYKEFTIIKSQHSLFPKWTQVLDLTKPESVLLSQMKSKTRYNIRLAKKKGVEIKEMSNEQGFEIFSKLYFETCKRQKYHGHNQKYHKILWESFKNNIAHIIIAFYNNIPLASFELFYFKNILYYPYGGTSLKHRNLMSSNLLMWEAIRLGKELGAKTFDMWGSLAPDYDNNSDWSGFTRFKQGYGCKFVEMAGSFDLVINKGMYKLYGLGHKLRKKILAF